MLRPLLGKFAGDNDLADAEFATQLAQQLKGRLLPCGTIAQLNGKRLWEQEVEHWRITDGAHLDWRNLLLLQVLHRT